MYPYNWNSRHRWQYNCCHIQSNYWNIRCNSDGNYCYRYHSYMHRPSRNPRCKQRHILHSRCNRNNQSIFPSKSLNNQSILLDSPQYSCNKRRYNYQCSWNKNTMTRISRSSRCSLYNCWNTLNKNKKNLNFRLPRYNLYKHWSKILCRDQSMPHDRKLQIQSWSLLQAC